MYTAYCLRAFNKLRALHTDTPGLVWSTTLQGAAQKWAQQLADTKNFHHDRNRGNVGENIYYSASMSAAVCSRAVLAW